MQVEPKMSSGRKAISLAVCLQRETGNFQTVCRKAIAFHMHSNVASTRT